MNCNTCEACGVEFVPSVYHPNQRFCGTKCRGKWEYENGGYNTKHVYICQHCGKEYVAKKISRDQYCSRKCAFAHKARPTRDITIEIVTVCVVCGKHSRKKYCSRECELQDGRNKWGAYARQRAQPKTKRECKECKRVFTPDYANKKRAFCSDKCGRKYARRISKAARRARIARAGLIESIDPIFIFKRDKWKCHICGCDTPKNLRGTTEPNAPELDHVIPLARGGTHTNENVACSCRKCNQRKGDRVIGQAPLWGGPVNSLAR